MAVFAAVDLGASGGRVMAGIVEKRTVRLEAVHRFANRIVERDGHLRWDLDTLFVEVQTGLARAAATASIGIDTWGVDYGLLDENGDLLAQPVAYRDNRTADVIEEVHSSVTPADLWAINGLQHLPFNTVFQLRAEQRSPLWNRAAHVVLLPDLLGYWLTGRLGTEATNASTTGLLDARTQDWSGALLDLLGIDAALLAPIEPPGRSRGCSEHGVPVLTVASHDTASAVVAVPATTENFAYVVSGTWSLVGLELPKPVLTDAARSAKFSNELGIDGTTRFLRNVGGLWLLQECLRSWGRTDLDTLLAQAAALPVGGPQVPIDDPVFIPPGHMPTRIAAAAKHKLSPAATVRCILDSLATSYARTVQEAVALTGRRVDVVHIVGGGSQNALLCQLTANAVRLPVVAGPVEATALGNVLVQARAHGTIDPALDALRRLISSAVQLQRFDPR